MSIQLPTEILQKIFTSLPGRDLIKCLKVCQRWHDIIQSINDTVWKDYCYEDYGDICLEAYRKANLSWLELYECLTMWSKVSDAEVTIRQIPGSCRKFDILENGVLSFPQVAESNESLQNIYDKIVHFDLKTFKKLKTEQFDYKFQNFIENDKVLVTETAVQNPLNLLIRAIPKDNSLHIENKFEDRIKANTLFVHGNKVYYVKATNILYRDYYDFINYRERIISPVRVTEINTDTFKTDKLIHYSEKIRYIKDIIVTDNETKVLTTDLDVYTVRNFEPKLICSKLLKHPKKFQLIKRHGLNSNHILPDWFRNIQPYALQKAFIYGYGKIIITYVPLCGQMLRIYADPYGSNDEPNLQSKPSKVINLDANIDSSKSYNPSPVRQIDVVETVNGHNIILLYCNSLYVIELRHSVRGKRSAEIVNSDSDYSEAKKSCP